MRLLLSLFLLTLTITGYCQITFRGMVVDSLTVDALPGVHVKVKNSAAGAITDAQGIFTLKALQTDTLILTLVGYHALELPLIFEEDVLIIRLKENVRMLHEITITSTRLLSNEITRSHREHISRPIAGISPVQNPFDYFSKWQRERRKLIKLIQENDRTITYLRVVSDQEIREELMNEFELDEDAYYDLLAKFNQQSKDIVYSTDVDQIIKSLKSFLAKSIK